MLNKLRINVGLLLIQRIFAVASVSWRAALVLIQITENFHEMSSLATYKTA